MEEITTYFRANFEHGVPKFPCTFVYFWTFFLCCTLTDSYPFGTHDRFIPFFGQKRKNQLSCFFSIKNPLFAGNEMNPTTVAKIVKYFLIFFRHQLRGSSLAWKRLELKSMQLPVDSLDCPSKGTYLQ